MYDSCTEWGITLSLYVRENVHNGLLYTLALYIIRVVGITEPCMDDCMQKVVDTILLCMHGSISTQLWGKPLHTLPSNPGLLSHMESAEERQQTGQPTVNGVRLSALFLG